MDNKQKELLIQMLADKVPADSLASDSFIPTLNKMGFMITRLDPFSQLFVDYAASHCCFSKNKALDIGAAYGIASLAALKRGAYVISNDIEPQHLEILQQFVPDELKSRLEISVERFPDAMHFSDQTFQAILVSRVLHFFDSDLLQQSLQKLHDLLKPGGKVFIIGETPYLKNWQQFIPEYEARKARGDAWPGIVTNPADYEMSSTKQLPDFFHFFDLDVLIRELEAVGFNIEKAEYINRTDFPEYLRLDGRESVGVVAKR